MKNSLNFENIKGFAFDLDGTLIDSIPDLAIAINAMLTHQKLNNLPIETIRGYVGKGSRNLVERSLQGSLKQTTKIDDNYLTESLKIYEQYYASKVFVESELYPHVENLLKTLKNKGFKLACVTNKDIKFTRPILENLELDRYFDVILGGSCLPKRKPDPLPLIHLTEQWKIQAKQLVMVGDSQNDIQSAKQANCPVIAVSYGYQAGEHIDPNEVDLLIDSLNELISLIK